MRHPDNPRVFELGEIVDSLDVVFFDTSAVNSMSREGFIDDLFDGGKVTYEEAEAEKVALNRVNTLLKRRKNGYITHQVREELDSFIRLFPMAIKKNQEIKEVVRKIGVRLRSIKEKLRFS